MSIPSTVACVTRLVSGKGGAMLRCLEAGRWKTISFLLSILTISVGHFGPLHQCAHNMFGL